jgi:hypothetical protein
MITKNAERIHRCLVNLQTILETDDTLSRNEQEKIGEALACLGFIDIYDNDNEEEAYPA